MIKRLARETSPYLQQHADNPVDWFPWGEEALRLAREQDKPILLSIGYSACHWCHVMAHESFEDPAVAEVMNRLFINIKVDREERPDLDQIYQTAPALLTRRNGGWPLTLFLTPDQQPFYGGTYFPKTARYGMPGFVDLLNRIAEAWREQRAAIAEQGIALQQALDATQPRSADARLAPEAAVIDDSAIERAIGTAISGLTGSLDEVEGGFGNAPKFPHPAELEFCLRFGDREPALRAHALLTLRKMACGGIFDQLGGGFARYSVDQRWMIPHFEKMLYDNGPLLGLYAHAWTLTNDPLYQRVAEETADWVMREMQSPAGAYYASFDADSEHVEGKFYVWSREQVCELLDADEYEVAAAHYGLDRAPNFEGQYWHLHIVRPLPDIAAALAINEADAQQLLARARRKLFIARGQRVHPGRDDKVLTSWNALMIRGMARAARVFGRDDWFDSARGATQFVFAKLRVGDRLLATYKDGRAHLNAYLDDYAFLALALLELLQARFDRQTLELARSLGDALLMHFEDRDAGGFFFVSHDHEPLILKPKPGHDQATPSGNGCAVLALIRLGHLLGETRYLDAAERALRLFVPLISLQASGFATFCMALAEFRHPTRVVLLRGPSPEVRQWQAALAHWDLPATLTLGLHGDVRDLPALLDKPAPDDHVNAFVCEGVTCLTAVESLEELRRILVNQRPWNLPPDIGWGRQKFR